MQWKNLVFHADCLQVIQHLHEDLAGQIRLIYIDPPFFTGTDYSFCQRTASSPFIQQLDTYSDRWIGGIQEYLRFMRERITAMKPLLTENGSLWVHLDWHVSHYVKILLDEIFGYANFVNEIVWQRTNSPKAQSRSFGSQHDVILLYANNAGSFAINPVYRELDERSLKPYSYEDERGRFRVIEIEARGIQRTENRKEFEWHGRTAPYLYSRETLDKWWEQGLIHTSASGIHRKKQYLDDVVGVPIADIWTDIPPPQGSSTEYTGFLTQKPIALLDRIITSASDPGDLVADFFAGSGTTALAATLTNRRWVLADTSQIAIDLIRKRLKAQGILTEEEYEFRTLSQR